MFTVAAPLTRRRWFQVRMRTLLLLMLVVCMGLGWVMNERRRIAERRASLEVAGFWFNGKLQPEWHRMLFGDDSPGFSREGHVTSNIVNDAGLAHLKQLTQLEQLYLGGTQVTDAGLVHLKGLAQLHELNLYFTQVTDAGLAHVEGIPYLHQLSLSRIRVTDAGLSHLKGRRNWLRLA